MASEELITLVVELSKRLEEQAQQLQQQAQRIAELEAENQGLKERLLSEAAKKGSKPPKLPRITASRNTKGKEKANGAKLRRVAARAQPGYRGRRPSQLCPVCFFLALCVSRRCNSL